MFSLHSGHCMSVSSRSGIAARSDLGSSEIVNIVETYSGIFGIFKIFLVFLLLI